MAIAGVLNEELRALDAEGLDVIQLDEPDFHFRHDAATAWGSAAIDRALEGSPGLRAAYARMLEKTSLYRMPVLAAAHSGSENSRAGEGCEIRIERDPAYPDQAYVIIKVTEERESRPTALIICDRDNHCEDYALPEMWDNTAQMVVELESDVCRRVRRFLDDSGMRAYLR